jgi:hypothetical protein
MRPKKPPRPKSEVFLNKHDPHPRRKRFSAFGVSIFSSLSNINSHDDDDDEEEKNKMEKKIINRFNN